MERRKLDLDYIQLFPRAVEHGLAPQHVEQSDFVAECRYVEGFGDAWLLHQQKPPHLVAHVQFATDEADFDKKLGTAIALQQLHEYIEGDLTFFCMLAGINADEVPATCQTESASLSVPSVPPQGGGMSTEKSTKSEGNGILMI